MNIVPACIASQLAQACTEIKHDLNPTLWAIHLVGSALDGGLKPHSDIDLLVTVSATIAEPVRHALLHGLLATSAPPGAEAGRRALDVTVIAHPEIVPWRYPPRRELQFGEWLRRDLLAGVFEPVMPDADLAILLTQARQCSLALVGPDASALFAPVPELDFLQAMADTLAQWSTPQCWTGDERNAVLALARIWYSAATGHITSKHTAATWLVDRLPTEHRPVLQAAHAAYLSNTPPPLAADTAAFIAFARSAILGLPGMAETRPKQELLALDTKGFQTFSNGKHK